ncbi:hypothetical protein BTS2_1696 [Bacillus sp. TS-2]|nr:hypothetical protein BTS2_1696 [Bacillus sp. TS-2]
MKDFINQETKIKKRLDEDTFEIPDFYMKSNVTKTNQLLQFLASPTKNPLELFVRSSRSFVTVQLIPVLIGFIMTLAPFIWI